VLREISLSYTYFDTAAYNTPERALMYAVLERAVRDLTPTATDGPQYLRSAILWFRNKVGAIGFMYSDVVEELKLTKYCQEKIETKLMAAESYVHTRDRQRKIERQNKLERQRQARRIAGSSLATGQRLSFRPEKPTIQWNGWNVGYNVG